MCEDHNSACEESQFSAEPVIPYSLAVVMGCHCRQDWARRKPRRPAETLLSADCTHRNNYYDQGRRLQLSVAHIEAWGRQHTLLRPCADALRLGDPEALSRGLLTFQQAVLASGNPLGPDVLGKLTGVRSAFFSAFHLSMLEIGCTQLEGSDRNWNGVNCALFAAGEYIGFTAAQCRGGSSAPPSHERIVAAETLLKGLSGFVRGEQEVYLPLWLELLGDLGFTRVRHGIKGDLVVYTQVLPPDSLEVAVHYGVVREVWPDHVWVESKAGSNDGNPAYRHPINVVEPALLMQV